MTQLRQLSLNLTQVTDAGVEHLKGLTQLAQLDLGGTRMTDLGLLYYLSPLKQLRQLDLVRGGTLSTQVGADVLKQSIPGLIINR